MLFLQLSYIIIIGYTFRFLWMQGVDRNGTAPPSLMMNSSSSTALTICNNDGDAPLLNHQDSGEPDSSSALPVEQFNDDDNSTVYGNVFDSILSELMPDLCLELIDMGGCFNEVRRLHRGRATTAPEVLEELMHPDMVSVPMTQLDTEQQLIAELKKCNQQKGSKVITLEISGTITRETI